ncbi:hypothetical protein EXE10_18270 [Acinetobacter sp. WCHAc060033]|uniref:hypothetical protein n=1 Tax=Acinetobacter sp. WCHAc060033 TaxID=2518624 RepID=UPI0010234710|nr:hypothetical protein [Acinetobacter sp. WCHAc060033]RZG78366.1 hypothetical protein EXE10_18270 [Acinetobacter sp. WCHAc060033]
MKANDRKVLIGIDTGVNTGFAVAVDSGNGGELRKVESLSITQAMSGVTELINLHGKENLKLFIEDARLRTWFTGGREKAQGVGSVKRDAQIWEDWCKEQELNYLMVHPKANATKTKAISFKKITGWAGRTNEHARDAAMLVFGRFARF